jgi:hypothetical protein
MVAARLLSSCSRPRLLFGGGRILVVIGLFNRPKNSLLCHQMDDKIQPNVHFPAFIG